MKIKIQAEEFKNTCKAYGLLIHIFNKIKMP